MCSYAHIVYDIVVSIFRMRYQMSELNGTMYFDLNSKNCDQQKNENL